MKCDLGAIACAIERMTNSTDTASTYDWWADIWIPVILGVLTLAITTGVAIASVLVARRSNALARQSNALARLAIQLARKADEAAGVAERLRLRREIGLDLVTLLHMTQQAGLGATQPELPAFRTRIRAKLNFSEEPAAEAIISDTANAFFGIDPFSAEGLRKVERASTRAKYGIEVWVRDPEKYADWVYRRDLVEEEPIEPDLTLG